MKTTSERRLLFALLLFSLVPLLALGVLSAAGVHRLGRALDSQALQTQEARTREALGAACRNAADRVHTFFRRREGELRSLALVAPTAESYRSFQRTSLSPLWAEGDDGRPARIWVPLYAEVRFVEPSGLDAVLVRDVQQPPGSAAAAPAPAIFRGRPLFSPSDAVTVSLAPEVSSGALRFSLPLQAPGGTAAGLVSVVLDPRHLEEQLRGNDPMPGVDPEWTLFFLDGNRSVVVWGPGTDHPGGELPSEMIQSAAEVLEGRSDVIPAQGTDAPWLAYAPLFIPAEGVEATRPAGGVILRVARAPGMVPSRADTLTGRAESQIGLLTVVAVFCVAFSALLVARRMAMPWARLREKAHAVAAGGEAGGGQDDVDAIARSFDSLASQAAASAGLARASEERLREFLELSPDGIAVVDWAGRFLHFNRAFCQTVRHPPNRLGYLRLTALFARPEDHDHLLDRLRDAGRLRNHEVELLRGDGSAFPALLTVRLGRFEGSECLDLILRDISEWREVHRRDREKTEALFRVYGELNQAHQALRRAYAEVEEQVRLKTAELRSACDALQASDRIKTEFLMRMSHELRTPLNCIIGYSDALGDGLDGPVTPDQSASLTRIAQSGRRLLRMIEDLLDLSRLEVGRLDLRCAELCIEDAICDVVHQARNLVGSKPVRLELGIDEPLPSVWADADRVRQVLFNLVGNAVKFTAAGWIRIDARRADTRSVEVRVTDTGPGIPTEHLENIFEKFTQLPGAHRTGAGLGLAISREIVMRMGGRVWVESSVGQGSCFGFTLPVAGASGQLDLPLAVPESWEAR